MGAYVFDDFHLHDREVVRFARQAERDDAFDVLGPEATYVGRRLADHPGIRAALDAGEEADI